MEEQLVVYIDLLGTSSLIHSEKERKISDLIRLLHFFKNFNFNKSEITLTKTTDSLSATIGG